MPIFTDGSALGNPRPCGGAAVVYTHGLSKDAIIIKRPVAMWSTSFHGEVSAIDLALEYVVESATLRHSTRLIHSDCQAALDAIVNNTGDLTRLTSRIVRSIKILHEKGVAVEFCWIPEHAGIHLNDLADNAAKAAAEEARAWTTEHDNSEITMESAKKTTEVRTYSNLAETVGFSVGRSIHT